MPQYHFPAAELTAEHRRSPIVDLRLDVAIPKETAAAGAGPELLRGQIQVSGEFVQLCQKSESRLRPGQLVTLKLTGPDGRFAKPQALLTNLKAVEPHSALERKYRWEFLVPARPSHDPAGLFRREGEAAPRPEEQPRRWQGKWNRPPLPLKPIQELDPAALEISVEELAAQLGALGAALDTPAVIFTAEGGFVPTHPAAAADGG